MRQATTIRDLTPGSEADYRTDGCETRYLCCTDATGPEGVPDGKFENCALKDGDLCPSDTQKITASCKTYADEWVLGIAELVKYSWGITNEAVKLLEVRFYPVQ
jgi:hypothetical protein